MWYNMGMSTSDWITLGAAILVGGGTLFLGIMAWRTIRQARSIQKAEKRGRLLNEIIEWATDITKYRSGKACKELLQVTDSSGTTSYKKSLQFVHAEIVETKETFVGLRSQGRYISKIALTFGAELHKATKILAGKIDEYVNYLDDWQDALADDIAKQNKHVDVEGRVSKADKIGLQMDKSAIKLMEEVAEIKTKDIN